MASENVRVFVGAVIINNIIRGDHVAVVEVLSKRAEVDVPVLVKGEFVVAEGGEITTRSIKNIDLSC